MARRVSLLGLLLAPMVACADAEPPWFVETLIASDTEDPLGGYTVSTVVVDNRAVAAVRLIYRIGWPSAPVEQGLERGEAEDLWWGQIPGPLTATRIYYFLEAVDDDGNTARDPALDPDMYSFEIRPPERPVPNLDGGTTDRFGSVDHSLPDTQSDVQGPLDAAITDRAAEDRGGAEDGGGLEDVAPRDAPTEAASQDQP